MILGNERSRSAGTGKAVFAGMGKIEIIILLVALVFWGLRFFRLFSYPEEFSSDELREIEDTVLRSTGEYGLFQFSKNMASAGNMLFIFASFFTPQIKENIELYRLFPVVINLLFAVGMYLLARRWFDKKTAMYTFFCVSVFISNYASSRIFLINNLVPLFMVYGIYFLDMAFDLKTKYLFLFAAVFLAGFNTYINWVYITPFLIYMVYEACASKKLDKRMSLNMAYFIVLSTCAIYVWFLKNSYMFEYLFSRLSQVSSGEKLNITGNIKSLFIGGAQHTAFFPSNWPYFDPAESLLILAGLFFAGKQIKFKEYRQVIVLFLVFLAPVFIFNIIHYFRINQLTIPFYLLAELGLKSVDEYKPRSVLIAALVVVLFSSAFLFDYHSKWYKETWRDTMNKNIAGYLNSKFAGDVLYLEGFDFDQPRAVKLRLAGYYNKNEKKFIALKMNYFWLKQALGSFEENGEAPVSVQSFKSMLTGNNKLYPSAVLVFPNNAVYHKYILYNSEIAGLVSQETSLTAEEWAGNADILFAKTCKERLFNTFLKEIKSQFYLERGMVKEAIGEMADTKHCFLISPDFYFKMSKCYQYLGDNSMSNSYYDKFIASPEYILSLTL